MILRGDQRTWSGSQGRHVARPGAHAFLARLCLWVALFALAAPPALRAQGTAPVRVLVVTGGHFHDPSFYSLFDRQQGFVATVDPHPAAYERDLQRRYDVLVLYDLVQELPEKQRTNLRNFVEAGKGVVVLHHAIADFNDWPWWHDEVLGGYYLLKPQGDRPASTYKVGVELEARPATEHPVTEGVQPFRITDEVYKSIWISPLSTVLVETKHPDADRALAWVSPYAKSRVVCMTLGHDERAHLNEAFRRVVKNAILWSAGAGVGNRTSKP